MQLPHALEDAHELLLQLGRGSTIVTYLARSRGTSQHVAIKLVPIEGCSPHELQECLERFARECAYQHFFRDYRDIVRALDSGETEGGQPFLVTEYASGETLEQLLGPPIVCGNTLTPVREAPLEPLRAVRLLRRVAVALGRLHHHRLVHRDIRPGNVHVVQTPRGERIKLGNLGSAWMLPKSNEGDSIAAETLCTTDDEAIVGTPYLSPELARGARKLSPASDIYSLGVVAYEMLTGRLPYQLSEAIPPPLVIDGEEITGRPDAWSTAWLNAHQNGELVPLLEVGPDLPAALADLLARCLARRPQERLQHTDEFIEQIVPLEEVLEQITTETGGARARPEASSAPASAAPQPMGEVMDLAMERDRLHLEVKRLQQRLGTVTAENTRLQQQHNARYQARSPLYQDDEMLEDRPTDLRPLDVDPPDPDQRYTVVLPGSLAESMNLDGFEQLPTLSLPDDPVDALEESMDQGPQTFILSEADLLEQQQVSPVPARRRGGYEVETLPDTPSWERDKEDPEE